MWGAGLTGYSTYFYTQAGLSTVHSFDMALGQYGLGILGTLLSWVLMSYFGRRILYVSGLGILSILLFIIGLRRKDAGVVNGRDPRGTQRLG